MKLSVVMPVYNERETLRSILERVRAVPIEKEIICIDDCSTDGTWDILQEVAKEGHIRLFRHPRNLGKGAAVRTGLNKVRGDIVIIQDADLEYDPSDYRRLVMPIVEGQARVVYGSRFRGHAQDMSRGHAWGNRFLTWATNVLFGVHLTDMETCYKVFTADAARRLRLKSPRWGFDPEITARLLKMGYHIVEVPISYAGRERGQGKKIRWQDGFVVLFTIIKCRFFEG